MAEITVNTSDYAIRCAREELAGWAGSLDAKRPRAWAQYGYPSNPTFTDFLSAYERGGAAHGAVHRILDKCWQERPRIKRPEDDKESPWEKKLGKLFKGINAWPKLRDFDRRNMVGRYAALIYRVADGKEPREPLQTAQRLVDLLPVFENQIEPVAWDNDTKSEKFGEVTMWQYRTRPVGDVDTKGRPVDWVQVHPSRVQILAEGSVGDFFDGVPLLKAGFNALVDLEKITGGSAESFLKNSARTVVMKFDAAADPQALTRKADGTPSGMTLSEAVDEKVRKLNTNQDAGILLQGGEASTLQTTISDPTKAFEVAASVFSASVQIPFTVLFGQQTGRLASDEDKSDMVNRCKSRQQNDLTPMLEQLVTRLQAAGLVEAGEFEIEWPALDAPGDDAKATLLGKLTAAMKQAFDAGSSQPLFDRDELRKVVDYEEKDAADEFREDDPPADPMADPLDPAPPAPNPAPAPSPRPVRAANDEDAGFVRRLISLLRRAA